MRMSCTSLLLLGVIVVATDAETIRQQLFPPGTPCSCSPRVREVCGNDGLTYKNICYLDCASKLTKGLKISYIGPCRSEFALCHCPILWRPICGSDGFTYGNICELVCAARFSPYPLKVTKFGVCSPFKAKLSSVTEVPATGETEIAFKETTAPAAIEDAATEKATKDVEEENPPSEEEEDDVCHSYKTCDRKQCKSEPVSHICGSNGHTYRNLCQFCCAHNKSSDVTIAFNGKCKKERKTKKKKKNANVNRGFEENEDEGIS